jgi:NitT/TauT family transport system substrate-binding protein
VRFSLAPQNTHKLADLMHRVGRLKTRPESWRDYFFPEAYGEVGS